MSGDRQILSGDELEQRLAEIEKTAELADPEPNPAAADRARRILIGEITGEQALDEIWAAYS